MKTIKQIQEEILKTSHLDSSRQLARDHFKECEINIEELEAKDFKELANLINIEIQKLSKNPKREVIPELKVNSRIKKNKNGVYLRASAYYFEDREGISFWKDNKDFPVGFCANLVYYNQVPFITGFIKWINFLLAKHE